MPQGLKPFLSDSPIAGHKCPAYRLVSLRIAVGAGVDTRATAGLVTGATVQGD
jgi:hypothetical protein